MQINVIGMLDRLFTSNTATKQASVPEKGTASRAVQDTAEIGKRQDVMRDWLKEEKKKAGIYEGETPAENEFAGQLAAIKQQLDTMINQMSGDDYAAMHADGVRVTSSDMEQLVTVVEQIKIRLAAYCEDYHPTGGIDTKDLEKVLGSAGMAAAVSRKLEEYDLPATDENVSEISGAMQRNESLTEITREQAAYLAENHLEPTIENVYRVQHSGVAVTEAVQPLSEADWQQLKGQVEQVILNSGADLTEENLETARWMIEHRVALDEENFMAVSSYTGLGGLQEGEQLDSILAAMANGKSAEQTSLLGEKYGMDAAQEVLEEIEEYVSVRYPKEDDSIQAITARRQLEEIRLMMTAEAGLSLLKKGIEIPTGDLEQLVDMLKKQEQEYYQKLYASEQVEWKQEDADLVKQTEQCRQELSQMPAYLSGAMIAADVDLITMQSSLEAGRSQKAAIEAAGEQYEALMTKPNQEYGDTMQKAFRNVDALLEDMGEELTEQNRRCIRILAYNQMALTRANLDQVRTLDGEYQYLLANLTPRVALHMIQKRKNPLNMEIGELNDQIEEIKQEIGPSGDEKYSEFLWKLEQTEGISQEERAAYIGIYRLLNHVNRQDSAALGALVSQGAEVTLENLLSAARSRKSRNMDIKIEDAFGMAEHVFQKNSITEQLKLFYNDSDAENQSYRQQMAENLKEMRADKKAQQLLAESEQTVSLDSLRAAGVLAGSSDTEIKKYWERQKRQGRMEEFLRKMKGKESLGEVYTEAEEELAEVVRAECAAGVTSYEGLEELRLYYHTAQLMTNLAKQEDYHIPLEYQGEITDVHLKVIHKTEESGKVSIETTLPKLGKISAEFSVRDSLVNGYIFGESVKVTEAIKGQSNVMQQAFDKIGLQTGQITCQTSRELPLTGDKIEGSQTIENEQLYDLAVEFLGVLKGL